MVPLPNHVVFKHSCVGCQIVVQVVRLDITQLRSAISSHTKPHITVWPFTTLSVEQWDGRKGEGRKRAADWEESFREDSQLAGVFEQILSHSTRGKTADSFATWFGWYAVTLLLGLARNYYRCQDHKS